MKLEKGKTYRINYRPKSPGEGRPFRGQARFTGTSIKTAKGETIFEFQGPHSIGFYPKNAISE